MSKNKEPDCTQCHDYCRVGGNHACTNIPQEPGKPCYKILKSLEICRYFWVRRKG